MKKLLTLLMCVAMAVLSTCSLTACNKTTLDDGVLTVGYTIYAPMNYFDDDNTFVGFDTELAKEVGKILDVEVEFVEINWDNKVMSLNSNEIDCVWNGMTITDELKEAMSITDAYLENRQVVICQASVASTYATKNDISKASEVLVEAGSAGNAVADGLSLPQGKLVTSSAQKDTLIEVKTSSSKVAIIDITMAQVLVGANSANPDLTYIDVGFENEEFGIGFRKEDTDTMNKVNDAIKTLKDNGKFNELKAKYFG